jgi:hypothetical protein
MGLLLPDVVHRIYDEGRVRAWASLSRRARPLSMISPCFPPLLSESKRAKGRRAGTWCRELTQSVHTGAARALSSQALRWDHAACCYEVIDGELFERRFHELRRKRDRDDGSNGRPFSRMHKYYKLQAGERWAKQVGSARPLFAFKSLPVQVQGWGAAHARFLCEGKESVLQNTRDSGHHAIATGGEKQAVRTLILAGFHGI